MTRLTSDVDEVDPELGGDEKPPCKIIFIAHRLLGDDEPVVMQVPVVMHVPVHHHVTMALNSRHTLRHVPVDISSKTVKKIKLYYYVLL